jgi:hypothetical protein
MNLDDLELELRKLPGVRAAGFTERDDMLVVQIQVAGSAPATGLAHEAARIAYRHADKPLALEVVRWKTASVPGAAAMSPAPTAAPAEPEPEPEPTADAVAPAPPSEPVEGGRSTRVRLLAVLTFPDTDELEVHLTAAGRRVIGRAGASTGAGGAVSATLDGLRSFVPDLDVDLLWAEELVGHDATAASVVACAIQVGGTPVLGIASGSSRIEASARSALHSLNRTLELHQPFAG